MKIISLEQEFAEESVSEAKFVEDLDFDEGFVGYF
jgi:hypothetical protein